MKMQLFECQAIDNNFTLIEVANVKENKMAKEKFEIPFSCAMKSKRFFLSGI